MKNNPFFYLIAISLLASACGSDSVKRDQSAPDNSSIDAGVEVISDTDLTEEEDVASSDLTDDAIPVDCSLQTEQECREAHENGDTCRPLTATFYQADLECYAGGGFVACGHGGNHLNTQTPARHKDGTCAIFSTTTLPSNGEWTQDDKCNDLLTESGYCDD